MNDTIQYMIEQLLNHLEETPPDNWMDIFGIKMQADGSIFDSLTGMTYDLPVYWAHAAITEDARYC